MTSTALEKTIADVWRDLLGVSSVGPDDNFFDRGGNSLLMIRVRHTLQEVLGTTIPIVDLFRYPTVRSLAESLKTEEVAVVSSQQVLRSKESNPFRPGTVPTPADPYLERASKQHAARDQLRDRAKGGSRS